MFLTLLWAWVWVLTLHHNLSSWPHTCINISLYIFKFIFLFSCFLKKRFYSPCCYGVWVTHFWFGRWCGTLATTFIHAKKVQPTHAYKSAWSRWWRWWQWWSICKTLIVPISINVIVRKWNPLHFIIQYCICNIRPFLYCMTFEMFFVGHDV